MKTLLDDVKQWIEIQKMWDNMNCIDDVIADGCPMNDADAIKFYHSHEVEIKNEVSEICHDYDLTPAQLLPDWDETDIFVTTKENHALLGRYGFECIFETHENYLRDLLEA